MVPLGRDGQQVGDERHDGGDVRGRKGEQPLQLVQFLRRRVILAEAGRPLELVDDRAKGGVPVPGRALVAQADVRLIAEPSRTVSVSRDLPMPGSPDRSTT